MIVRSPNSPAIKQTPQHLHSSGYRSLAIVFAHFYTYPQHERLVMSIAREVGLTQVSQSANLVPMTKLVPRGPGCTADAYLNPILHQYLNDLLSGFDAHSCKGSRSSTSSASSSSGSKSTGRGDKREKEGTRKPRVEFMSPSEAWSTQTNLAG
ncbi:hypothetical protein D9758_014665 [Tetrapyrgos nigripes]|uniref:Hydantoinase/oxoprolinase N-terminal domain-containing protein n=1 Tax=Tetrapyrgos nigripes TaxID=182062 RepID=A0A8H5CUK4_9AGAR|nr:hypothetical protein D9758_014665 [Tetrapyrgos nigripes]